MLSFLLLVSALELGYFPAGDVILNQASKYYQDSSIKGYLKLEASVYAWDVFYVGGSMIAYTHMSAPRDGYLYPDFLPHTMLYEFKSGFDFGSFELGYRHFCIHPVTPYHGADPYLYIVGEGARDEVFLRIESGRK